jgi:hypothetical protein
VQDRAWHLPLLLYRADAQLIVVMEVWSTPRSRAEVPQTLP